ncbi:MAG TPA: deoxyribonuclease V [Pseudonocardiaceae bacterium]|jgi:deoxyribonuclease V|nr:deoxyribonuclease V [Pseudonocardiaceae bacterium]
MTGSGLRFEVPGEWPVTQEQALAEQDRLRPLVRRAGLRMSEVRTVAGLDVSYAKDSDWLVAAVVTLAADTLAPVERHTVAGTAIFPYVPGLFAFRELPTLLNALALLETAPDVLVCDGYGLAHPRRFGLASHVGVLTGVPSIGVAKTAFVGEYTEPAAERGAYTELRDGDEVIGRVLRTRDGVKPVFVSIGHAVDLDTATELVLALTPRYRLPETTRAADHLSREALKQLT